MRTQGIVRVIAAFSLMFVAIAHAVTLETFPLLPPSAQLYGNCGPTPRCFAVLDDLKPGIAVVGASGQVSIFERQTTGEWQLTTELLDPLAPLPRPYYNSRFGYLASLDNDMLAVAATPEDRPSPVIYVFTREQGQWSLLQTINLSHSFGDVYLNKMLLRDGTLVVSQIEYAADSSGQTETKVLVFSQRNENERGHTKGSDGTFQLLQQLDPATNPDPDTAYNIEMDVHTLVLATPNNGASAGAVYLYRKVGAAEHHPHATHWQLRQIIRQPAAASGFGSAISLSGNMLAIAAPGEPNPPPTLYPGAVYIYRQHAERWRLHDRIVDPVTEETDPPCDICLPPSGNPFGTLIALSGNRLLIKHFIAADRGFSIGIVFEQQQGGWAPVARIGDLALDGEIVIQNMLLAGATAWLAETPLDVFSPSLNIYDLPALSVGQAAPVADP